MTWSLDCDQGVEALKVRWDIVPFTRGRVLDLGCSIVSPFVHFTGVDLNAPAQANGRRRPDIQADCSAPMPIFGDGSWDSVFSSHLLEHIEDYKAALKEWWRIVRIGGYLVLYLPHKDLYPNVGDVNGNSEHKHDFVPDDILSAMKEFGGFDFIENQVRSEGDEYSFFQVYRKRADEKIMDFTQNHPKKTAGVFRCGAFGDMIQASSVIRALHDEGYAVTLHTSPRGYGVVKKDPFISRVMIQDEDQVPNHELASYWAHLAKKYTKFVNLSGSVEESMLAMPGNPNHRWPHALRHATMNRNYVELQHAVAEVDAPIRPYFYESAEESAWANIERQKFDGPLVLWSLSGSAVHKSWPRYAEAIEAIVENYPTTTVALMGDERCAVLAKQFDHPRIIDRCGVWDIRNAMAMCNVADLIIGPETGILNAAGHMKTAKICLLSHSSPENLTKHWINTEAITPVDTPCYPCHILHKGFDYCHEVKPSAQVIQWANANNVTPVGNALCMENISLERVMSAVERVLPREERNVLVA